MFCNWLRPMPRRVPPRAHKSSLRFRPDLEALEDRLVPSTFTVTTSLDVVKSGDHKMSLREAISRANHHAGPDIIVLPGGVFKMALAGAGDDANLSGDFDVTGTVTIQGVGANATIIDAQKLDRVFHIHGGVNPKQVTIQGLTVRNGRTDNGGGILVGRTQLHLLDSVVSDNSASFRGGGLSNFADADASTVTLVRSSVSRNVATIGGGIALTCKLTLSQSAVRRNLASTVNGGLAGGISGTTVRLTNSTVSGNFTRGNAFGLGPNGSGGGIAADTVILTNSTVNGNIAVGDHAAGGGITASTVILTNSTVSGNRADYVGGGIAAFTAATLTNSTVSGNSTSAIGGGIYARVALTLLNVTITENNAEQAGGGVFLQSGGKASVKNTIIAPNLVPLGRGSPDVSGAFTSLGHNLIGNPTGSTGFSNGSNGDQVGTSTNPLDPKLGPLANNGGRTLAHALLPGSRAIDRGNNGAPLRDQRGILRPRDGDGNGKSIVDIGAFER